MSSPADVVPTLSVPAAAHRMPTRTRFLVALGTAALLALVLLPWVVPFGPLQGDATGTLAAIIVMGLPALLLTGAAGRGDLDPRLRGALALLALSMGLAIAVNGLRFLIAVGMQLPAVPGLRVGSNVVIGMCGLAALLRIPLVRLGRAAAWQIGTDTTIAVGGMALAIFAVWTLPGFGHAPRAARLELLADNAIEAANLVALSLILVRGPTRPLRRAVWCLAATIIIETTYLVALQYALGAQTRDFRLANSLFFVDYVFYFFAALFFLTDQQPETDLALLPESVRAFNPLPMAAILGVSVLLILATRHPGDPALFPLALGFSALALLLLARVVGATTQILRLAREEAALQQRDQLERLNLMGRMAGGIAHVINNLMTVVLGHASLIAEAAEANPGVSSSGEAISTAAHQASRLAERLLLVSGYRRPDGRRGPLLEAVNRQREAIGRLAGPARVVVWDLSEDGGRALVASTAVEAVLRELVTNSIDATTDGGLITIRVRDETPSGGHAGMILSPQAGRHSVLSVEDAGCGIAPDAVMRICEPYFTTRPVSEGRGLGLSVVYGIVVGLPGGLQIKSHVGAGTRVSVYFPI
jgi:signal transduction histidine kinase